MASDFPTAVVIILAHEGGSAFTNRPDDKGGPTRWGITAATLGRWRHLGRAATAEEVMALERSEAVSIYRAWYWDAFRCGDLRDQMLATKVFDIAVNCRPHVPGTLLQRAVNRCQEAVTLDEDGEIGPLTLAAANRCDPRELVIELGHVQEDHYRAVVDADPTQKPNLKGWLSRAKWPWPALAAVGPA